MFEQHCGSDESQLLDVSLLRAGTEEMEVHIRSCKNGERAWNLLCELYNVREQEERYLREEISTCLRSFRSPWIFALLISPGNKTFITLNVYAADSRSKRHAKHSRQEAKKAQKLNHSNLQYPSDTLNQSSATQGIMSPNIQTSYSDTLGATTQAVHSRDVAGHRDPGYTRHFYRNPLRASFGLQMPKPEDQAPCLPFSSCDKSSTLSCQVPIKSPYPHMATNSYTRFIQSLEQHPSSILYPDCGTEGKHPANY